MDGAKRLSRDTTYERPKKTYQEMLSNEEIKEKLKDYKKVVDIKKVSIGTHLRYFVIDKNKEKHFRLGGTLNKFGDNGEYIILSNGKLNWSVQIKNSIFFQKLTEKEFKEEMKEELKKEILTEIGGGDDSDIKNEIKTLKKKLEKFEDLKKQNNLLKQQLKDIEKEILKKKNKQ